MGDKLIQSHVQEALSWEPSLDSADLAVTVEDGIAHILGHVPTYPQKLTAEMITRDVRGVRGLVNDVQVRLCEPALSDEAIAERAANILDWLVDFPQATIKVKVDNGVLTLTGNVVWKYQKQAAEEAVQGVDGVRGIDNEIQVVPLGQTAFIEEAVRSAIERQAKLEFENIKVSVRNGTVRLDGRVRTAAQRALAERIAWSTNGVKSVEDHLMISV